jgi:hypothetical protein
VVTLEGRIHVFSLGYSCSRSRCSQSRVIYRSVEADQLSPKGSSFGFDVIVQVGWWRFWDHRTLDEIDTLLKALRLPVSRRQILYLIGDFLALLRAAQPAKIESLRTYFQRHGLVISIDGMEPEQGNEMLFIVREANLDLTLVAETLYSSRADLISHQLLEPIKDLGFRIRAVVSDADKNIRRAVEASLPGCPHQACQVHCLCDAGKLIFEADRAMKTDLRRDIRAKLRPLSRQLSQASQDDPVPAVLVDYCEALRDDLRADNELELFFKDMKHHQRRITGRKSVHDLILRYGPFAAFIDYAESFDDLLARLRQVKPEDFKQARQALQKVEMRLKKLYRFRHHPDKYYRDLEDRWEKAISS